MSEEDLHSLKYPVGKFQKPSTITSDHLKEWKSDISELPYNLRKITAGIREKDLEKTYRPDGWTARQVIHHIADSHINAYVRFKWALTESTPLIKPYNEVAWAELEDSSAMNIDISLKLIDALHTRWIYLINSVSKKTLERCIIHPDHQEDYITLEHLLGHYSWHGRHHSAHLNIIKERLKY